MLSEEAALIHAMVAAVWSGRAIAQDEFGAIGDLIDHLPIFAGIDRQQVRKLTRRCSEQLAGSGGVDLVYGQIRAALPGRLREAAYALSCDVVALCRTEPGEQGLERIRAQLDVDPAMARTIERVARLRSRRPEVLPTADKQTSC